MKAFTVIDREAGIAGMVLSDQPMPHASENDVIVRVHASGFTPGSSPGRVPGATGPGETVPRASPVTRSPVSSPNSATGPPV